MSGHPERNPLDINIHAMDTGTRGAAPAVRDGDPVGLQDPRLDQHPPPAAARRLRRNKTALAVGALIYYAFRPGDRRP